MQTYRIEHHVHSLFSTSDNLTRCQQKPRCGRLSNLVQRCRDAKVKYLVQTSYSFPLLFSSSPPLLLLLLLLPGAGCICTMGVDGGGGWGRAEHGNHLKVGWLLWRPAAAQWQQRELIELHRGGESCRAVESTEDYTHVVTHTYTQHSLTHYTCEDYWLH